MRIEVLNESDLYEKDKITYIDLFNAKFNVLFGLTLFQNDSIEAKQLCAKWLIETYYECKDKNLLDTVFRYKRLLPLIKNKDEKRLLNIIKNYKNYSDLQKEQIKFIQKIFSIMNEKDYKIITIFGIRIKLKRKASKENIIISLTSYPARIKTVSKTIKTLLNQTMKADKVILWLSEEEFPNKEKDLPQELLDLKNNNFSFEIDWCENIKSYKKLIPALKKYPNSVIITADDDLLYEPDRVKLLYKEHLKHPKDVICHRAHFITFSKNKINEYKNWIQNFRFNITSNNLFPTTGAMALYPINSLYKDVLDKSLFYNLAYNTDDIWFWAMCILNDTKIRLAKGHISSLTKIENTQEDVLWHDNVNNGRNDKNLKLMFEYYPMLYKKISKRKHIHYSIQDIFSLTNSIDKRHKIITILGIKIKIKRNLSKK